MVYDIRLYEIDDGLISDDNYVTGFEHDYFGRNQFE